MILTDKNKGILKVFLLYAIIAQLAEQQIRNLQVGSAILPGGTKKELDYSSSFYLLSLFTILSNLAPFSSKFLKNS